MFVPPADSPPPAAAAAADVIAAVFFFVCLAVPPPSRLDVATLRRDDPRISPEGGRAAGASAVAVSCSLFLFDSCLGLLRFLAGRRGASALDAPVPAPASTLLPPLAVGLLLLLLLPPPPRPRPVPPLLRRRGRAELFGFAAALLVSVARVILAAAAADADAAAAFTASLAVAETIAASSDCFSELPTTSRRELDAARDGVAPAAGTAAESGSGGSEAIAWKDAADGGNDIDAEPPWKEASLSPSPPPPPPPLPPPTSGLPPIPAAAENPNRLSPGRKRSSSRPVSVCCILK